LPSTVAIRALDDPMPTLRTVALRSSISPTSATARGSVSRPHEAMLSAANAATAAAASLTRGPAPLTIVPIIAVAAVGGPASGGGACGQLPPDRAPLAAGVAEQRTHVRIVRAHL